MVAAFRTGTPTGRDADYRSDPILGRDAWVLAAGVADHIWTCEEIAALLDYSGM